MIYTYTCILILPIQFNFLKVKYDNCTVLVLPCQTAKKHLKMHTTKCERFFGGFYAFVLYVAT